MKVKEELPPEKSLVDAMSVAKSSPEAAKYLCIQFDKKIFAMKLGDEAKPLQEQMKAFAKYVAFQLNPNKDIWPGKASATTTAFEKLQVNLATEGVKALENSKGNEYTMYIAVSDDGDVLRAYTAEQLQEGTKIHTQAEVEAAGMGTGKGG